MPFYESGKIVLNRNESECFRKQLKAPDPVAATRRLKPIEYFPLHSERWSGKRDFYSEQCPANLSYHEAEFQDCA